MKGRPPVAHQLVTRNPPPACNKRSAIAGSTRRSLACSLWNGGLRVPL